MVFFPREENVKEKLETTKPRGKGPESPGRRRKRLGRGLWAVGLLAVNVRNEKTAFREE